MKYINCNNNSVFLDFSRLLDVCLRKTIEWDRNLIQADFIGPDFRENKSPTSRVFAHTHEKRWLHAHQVRITMVFEYAHGYRNKGNLYLITMSKLPRIFFLPLRDGIMVQITMSKFSPDIFPSPAGWNYGLNYGW